MNVPGSPSMPLCGRKRRRCDAASTVACPNNQESLYFRKRTQACRRYIRTHRARFLVMLIGCGIGLSAVSIVSASITELSWSSSSSAFPSEANAVVTDNIGNIIVCGTWQEVSTSTAASHRRPYVSKYSPTGAELWRLESWGNTMYGGDCVAVDVDASTSIYVAVNAPPKTAVSTRGGDFYIFKLDATLGKLMWRRDFDAAEKFDEVTSMRADLGGALYVGGFSRDTSIQAASNLDGFVYKLDASTGNTMWLHVVSSLNNGDDRVFGVDSNILSGSVFLVGDTTGTFTASDQEASIHQGEDLFIQRVNAQSGQVEWTRRIGLNMTSEICRLSAASISSTDINPETVTRRRGNCDLVVSPDATHLFVVGTTIGGSLSTDVFEQRAFRRECAASATTCANSILARVDSKFGNIQWLRQLVSRASSSGERAVIVPSQSSKSNGFDVVLVALADAGFLSADAMEQLVVLRLAGSNGETLWLKDIGDSGPDRAVALAGVFASRLTPSESDESEQGAQNEELVLALRAGTRRRGETNTVTTTLTKLNTGDGRLEPFCRDAITFGTNQTMVVRPVAQMLVVALPVYLVGSVRCTGSSLSPVSYETFDGTAAAGIDFIQSSGALQLTSATEINNQAQIAEVAVQVLPQSSPDLQPSVTFFVRLQASPEATEMVEPFEMEVSIEPSALLDHVQATVSDGSFWERLTQWTTAAISGALVFVLFLRVCCSRRLAWLHRQRMAFEYKSLRLHDEVHEDDSSTADGSQPTRARSGRWWRWRRGSAGRDKPRQPSSSAVGSVGVTRKPSEIETIISHQEQPDDIEEPEEIELRSHLASIQSLNASLDQWLAASESADIEAAARLDTGRPRSSPRHGDRAHRSPKHRGLRLALRLSASKSGKATK